MLQEVVHVELNEKVYLILKNLILTRQFKGGEKLDLEEISNRMKISRTPLKDAVNRLVSEGLLEVEPRKGTFVTCLTSKDVIEMMEIRLMIETWAITYLTEEQVVGLADKLEMITDQAQFLLETENFNYNQFLDLDIELHNSIVGFHNSDKMNSLYRSLNSSLFIARIYYFKNFDRSLEGQHEHLSLVKAIREFRIMEAIEILKNHLETSKAFMLEILNENKGML